MKVVYSNRSYNFKNVKRFEGPNEEITFEADKIFINIMAIPAQSFYFNKMTGRPTRINGFLPSFMINLANRNSCICLMIKV